MVAMLMNIIGAFMLWLKVKEGLVVTNYGFILGPVVGFMLDQGLATDVGFRDFMTANGFNYTFASLVGGHFIRYIVTVFLDLFISNPLQDIMKRQVKKIGVMAMLLHNEKKSAYSAKYDLFVAQNFPSILQSIVGFVTFNAYTNQTRFAWAYASEYLERDFRIPPGTIMLCTAIAAVLYLNFYFQMETFSDREYFDLNGKLIYVLVTFMILYGLNSSESMEAPIEGETDNDITGSVEADKPILGVFLFIFFLFYGLVYPISTRTGCCGKCKPSEEELEKATDHMMNDCDVPDVRQQMLSIIVAQRKADTNHDDEW